MKHHSFTIILVMLLFLSLCTVSIGCADTPQDSSPSAAAAALSLLTEKTSMSEESAVDILAQLHRVGLSNEIRMVFVVNQEDETIAKYRIWTDDAAIDITLDENGFVTDIRNETTVYLSTSEDITPQIPTIPSSPTEQTPSVDTPTDTSSSETITEPEPSDPPAPVTPTEPTSPSIQEEITTPTTPESLPTEETTTQLHIVSLTNPIAAGKTATLQASGVPGTEYDISVRYSSGESTAKGLESQIAAADGSLRWSFRVSSRVAAGEYPITVTGGGETVTITMSVTK